MTINEYSGSAVLAELDEYHRRRASGEIRTVATGIEMMDRHLEMEPGNLVILAARPKQGKTATAISMFCSQVDKRVAKPAFFSLEMNKMQILIRMLANLSGVPSRDVKNGVFSSHSLRAKIDKARAALRDYPMQLCGDRGLGVEGIIERVSQMVVQAGSNIVYIDQLSFIQGKGQSERERFDSIVRGLKDMAEEIGVVVVLLCQVNREGEKSGKGAESPPRMEHLYGCDGIAQTADMILCPWYPNSQRDCPIITINGESVNVENKIILRCIVDREGEGWAEMMDFDGATSCLNRVRV